MTLELRTVRDFLQKILLRGEEGQMFICSLKNDKSDPEGPNERHILTRDPEAAEKFAAKYDVEGRGTYLSVSTLKKQSRRVKSNAVNKSFAHCDIDPKSVGIDKQEIISKLKALDKPPSYIVDSGHGAHAYWLYEVRAADDASEDLDRDVSDMLGGDRQVAQRVALMRLPGSFNTKNGQRLPVSIVHKASTKYTFAELQAWAKDHPVIIERLNKEAGPEDEDDDDDPFMRYAKEYDFKPPLDVDERLAQMEFQGAGDKSVHATQLAVTASMLARGDDVEDVVQRVLEATKAVAPASWNWKEEEKTIRGMCRTWNKKLEKKEQRVSNVVNLDERRAAKQAEEPEAPKKEGKKSTVHHMLGKGFLASLRKRGDDILICREELWRCTGGLWRALPPGEAKSWLDREIEEGCRTLKIVSTQKIINESRAWIMRNPEIYRNDVPWDAHGKIACLSGLLDPNTMDIEKIEPSHYVTMRIECEYDPSAKCDRWLSMLNDIFPNEPDTISAMQEIAGTGLLLNRPRQLMRALIFVGPAQSGKSNLLNVLGGMFTKAPNTTTFDLLENPHGTVDFLRNVPWVLHEAFDQSKWHFSSVVKALLSGDPISVNIKNGPIVDRQFKLPVFWGTNSPPQFKEASRAIETRVRIIKCKQVFDPSTITGIAKEAHDKGYSSPSEYVLDNEMSGLLNWFLEGMKRATKRGYLADTAEMVQASKDLRTSSNFMTAFIEDAVDYSSTHMVSIPDLIAAVHIWWEENRGEGHRVPSSDMIMKSLESLYDARIAVSSKSLRYNLKRYVAGIKLNDMGMSYWKAKFNAAVAKGDSLRISGEESEVNALIPADWIEKKAIAMMVAAHKEKQK